MNPYWSPDDVSLSDSHQERRAILTWDEVDILEDNINFCSDPILPKRRVRQILRWTYQGHFKAMSNQTPKTSIIIWTFPNGFLAPFTSKLH